jgi:hypothetical protein
MSLYNAVFGSRDPSLITFCIGKTADDFGRYRDVWIENSDGRLILAVYTRCGGGNAGNAWLRGFTAAFGGGIAVPALAPAGAGTGAGGQVTINNIQNTSKSISVSINASTAEAGRAATVSVYGLVMY